MGFMQMLHHFTQKLRDGCAPSILKYPNHKAKQKKQKPTG